MLLVRALVCVCVVCVCVSGEPPCLMISEVNCDNPKLDTAEFVELYHSSGVSTSLDGYKLVFYDGSRNRAYRVIELNSHLTDQRGFFLIGSVHLKPSPQIPLPPNIIQNGPDAIALYGPGEEGVSEGDEVSTKGLIDALVYSTRRGGVAAAQGLADVLTPSWRPFVEDAETLEGDESIQRCWLANQYWTFHTATPTPGQANHCQGPKPTQVLINELRMDRTKGSGFVELWAGDVSGPVSVVTYDGLTERVTSVKELGMVKPGFFLVNIDTSSLAGLDTGAVAVYEGGAANFSKDSPLSQQQPIDAFVFVGPVKPPSANLTETLTPGKSAFQLSDSRSYEDNMHVIRCGISDWTRDPGMFVIGEQSPGEANQCPWFITCPDTVAAVEGTLTTHAAAPDEEDFLINEVNADMPGSAEDEEFVELWHPSGRQTSLENIWLLLFNGNTGKPYREISLYGHHTDQNGYFLVGSDRLRPPPDVPLPPNTIQNGLDAVAIYRSFHPPSSTDQGIPQQGLLDAVVYRIRASDRDTGGLSEALSPGQRPLVEDPSALPGDESISRCHPQPRSHTAFVVAPPTPRKENDCPRPPTMPPPPVGVVINEVGGVFGSGNAQQTVFVELSGPQLTALHGVVVMVTEGGSSGRRHDIPLNGSIGSDGFYLLGSVSGADAPLPVWTSVGAVLVCVSVLGVCDESSVKVDSVVFSNHTLLNSASANTTQLKHTATRPLDDLTSASRCVMENFSDWIISVPTPRAQNSCPGPAYSTLVHLCLQPGTSDWQDQSDCSRTGVVRHLERICQCGISSLHLHGVNVSCMSGLVYVDGSVLALSLHQRELISHSLDSHTYSCGDPAQDHLKNAESSVGLQVGLISGVVLLLGLAVFLFVYHYRKRRPLDYQSMQLSDHGEALSEL